MLKQVSWANYAYAITILLIIYYIAIVIIYYSKSIFKIVNHKRLVFGRRNFIQPNQSNSSSTLSFETSTPQDNNLYVTTQHLIEKLQNLFQKGGGKLNKNFLIKEAKIIISGYTKLKGTPFETSVNNFLIIESQINCSINLSEEELRELWIGE